MGHLYHNRDESPWIFLNVSNMENLDEHGHLPYLPYNMENRYCISAKFPKGHPKTPPRRAFCLPRLSAGPATAQQARLAQGGDPTQPRCEKWRKSWGITEVASGNLLQFAIFCY